MDDLMRTVIAQEVGKQLDRQKEELQKALFQGCDHNDTLEKICAMMVINSVYYSVTLAAEIAIGILLESGEFTPRSEEELRRHIFSVCGQKDEQTPDTQK